ncbi:probable glutathione S-transferase [Prosopis cineraria]|uniref:probable glutathione S-transferase n=1 Tax=Prosopis cineraria TaxID=364024 RepID=UPI00240F37C4|nr:probable glutathione S-transferase [Prosopis cineraria]
MAEECGEVKFFGSGGSPYARRVQIALKLKGVEYKHFEEDIRNKSELLLKYNPVHKKVPVLVHNDNPIAESLIILEYIDETWKTHPILPLHPYHRALARFWSRFIDDKVLPAIQEAAWTVKEKEREKAIEEAREGLGYLEKELKGKFFGGDAIGIVDIAASYIAFWLPLVEEATALKLLSHDKFPKLHRWSQEFCSHPVVRDNLPPPARLLAFFKARYAAIAASK